MVPDRTKKGTADMADLADMADSTIAGEIGKGSGFVPAGRGSSIWRGPGAVKKEKNGCFREFWVKNEFYYKKLKAVFGWVWSKHWKGFSWSLLYVKVTSFCGDTSQVNKIKINGDWSGFMSEARGLTWDRKSRYGKK